MHRPAGKQRIPLSVCHMRNSRLVLCGLISVWMALLSGCATSPQPSYVDAELFSNVPLSIRPTGVMTAFLATSSPSNYFLKESSGSVLLPPDYDSSVSPGAYAVLAAGEVGAVIVQALVRKIATATVKPSSKEFVEKIKRMKAELPKQLSSLASSRLKDNLQDTTTASAITVFDPSPPRSSYEYTSPYEYVWRQSFRHYQPDDVLDPAGFIVEFGFIDLKTENGLSGSKGKVTMGIAIVNPNTLQVVGRDTMTDTFAITVEEDSPEYEEQVTADFKKSTIKLVDELVKKVVRQL